MPTENADIAQPSSPPGERSTSFGPTLRVADLGASPLTGSKICPYCNDPECENPMFCAAYEPDAALRTVAMHDMEALDLPVQDMWGNALFSQHRLLLLQIAGVTASLVLHPNERILLGRMNERASEEHVLDLTAYEGHLKGVSRIHAAIAHAGHTLTLADLGSTNGTFINEQRLIPHQPRILRDGDTIRLGNLIAHVHFK